MSIESGVWIDHRKAVVVHLTAAGEHVSTLLSHADKHPERAGDSPLSGKYDARQVPADDSRQRAFTGELNRYYDLVLDAVRDASAVLILGPGEAKGELQRRFIDAKMGARVAGVETSDKLTDAQVAARVRTYFAGRSAST